MHGIDTNKYIIFILELWWSQWLTQPLAGWWFWSWCSGTCLRIMVWWWINKSLQWTQTLTLLNVLINTVLHLFVGGVFIRECNYFAAGSVDVEVFQFVPKFIQIYNTRGCNFAWKFRFHYFSLSSVNRRNDILLVLDGDISNTSFKAHVGSSASICTSLHFWGQRTTESMLL